MDHSELVKSHFNEAYVDYDKLIRRLIPRYDEMHNAVVDSLEFPPDHKLEILDLGIGTGQTALKILEKFPNSRIDGIDISKKMINVAKSKLRNYKKQVSFKEEDISKLHLTKRYDIVISVMCIHHLNSDQKKELFHKILTALKPNGIFIIGDIIKFDTEEETKKKEGEWRDFLKKNFGNEADYWFKNYQEEDLPDSVNYQIRWLEEAGFKSAKSLLEYINFAVLKAEK